ncbi:MAG: phosphoribosylaminoimidazolesuccinocarboxamide synthase [Chloroflexi bacterium]|nr:MAG: phosphoribosylaminoimidazolesuccinocarboxamide synthase [Chloroflexota bacterium]TMF77762.1 MAG: phosphoribosylaminoimidazolesuccinocarboxamide synthase [Chloroflexota bacterium]TMF78459.1 MAG: phosphoribosylaminoimidazolesuccinocarboxamide synthase [Chloroflexota bacterium]TMF92278.1 MAG: phosphoribosylaminoimidazolesuccinocarboxamide synthase [Chloroflexota bacterium]TMG43239.1 MAG: phosphoribosylaminoimidazolesuccinocarboxamide synthase [Chloroflexota bacterium]
MIAGPPLTDTELPLKLFMRGKVRDTYELGSDRLLMVATDRISAFDHVLPNGIPDRGKVLTQLSIFWFSQTDTFQPNHLVSGMVPDLPPALKNYREELAGRFMIVRKAKRIDFECVVRGYLAGSAWKEYQETQTLAGEKMPPGLRQSEKLAYPTFSPATKAESGHDENITFDQMKKELGDELATKLRDASLELYKYASEFSARRGLILADTKFEFGVVGEDVILIDEVLTPDSSRYWDGATYRVGVTPEAYDKQFVRDWLTRSGWDKESDPPRLPDDVVTQTRLRYLAAYQRLVGKQLFPPKPRNEP